MPPPTNTNEATQQTAPYNLAAILNQHGLINKPIPLLDMNLAVENSVRLLNSAHLNPKDKKTLIQKLIDLHTTYQQQSPAASTSTHSKQQLEMYTELITCYELSTKTKLAAKTTTHSETYYNLQLFSEKFFQDASAIIKRQKDELTASKGSVERDRLDKLIAIKSTQDGFSLTKQDKKKCLALTFFCIFNHRDWNRKSPEDPLKPLYPKDKFAYFAKTATSIRTIWHALSTTNKHVLIDDVTVIYEHILIWNCVNHDYQSMQSRVTAATRTACSSTITKKHSDNANKLQQEIIKKRQALKIIEQKISEKIALLEKNKTLLTLKEAFHQPSDNLKTKSPLPEEVWNTTPNEHASDPLIMDQLDIKITTINNFVLFRSNKTGDHNKSDFDKKVFMHIRLIREMSEHPITLDQFSLYCEITQLLSWRNELLIHQKNQQVPSYQVKKKKRKRQTIEETEQEITRLENNVTDIIEQLQNHYVKQSKEKYNDRLSTKLEDNETYAELLRLWDPKTTQDNNKLYYLIRLRAHITRCIAITEGGNTIKKIQDYQALLVSIYHSRGVIDEETMTALTSLINQKNTELDEESQANEADYNNIGLFTKTNEELWQEFNVTGDSLTSSTTPFDFSEEPISYSKKTVFS